ncbi:MAG: RNase adapter RapZ, partial [Candidatus Competibacteraceae bacterium]|nr:RNase adapter RapZ [Candidatus Competibacteraceae bacterium]
VLADLTELGLTIDILFLQATDDALVQRYHETRRKHPLGLDGSSLMEAIQRERRLLQAISAHATMLIDSSQTNVHELRDLVRSRLHTQAAGGLILLFESFGYKHGVPADADFVFDVRFLPNPHWDRKLRLLTGLDKPVRDFLLSQDSVLQLLDDLKLMLERWIPRFDDGSRSYLTVAIGCTGGQHRSVFIAAELAEHFSGLRPNVKTRHRELGS